MYDSLIDEAFARMMKTIGIECAVTWNDTAHWNLERTGSRTWVWLGRSAFDSIDLMCEAVFVNNLNQAAIAFSR